MEYESIISEGLNNYSVCTKYEFEVIAIQETKLPDNEVGTELNQDI